MHLVLLSVKSATGNKSQKQGVRERFKSDVCKSILNERKCLMVQVLRFGITTYPSGKCLKIKEFVFSALMLSKFN